MVHSLWSSNMAKMDHRIADFPRNHIEIGDVPILPIETPMNRVDFPRSMTAGGGRSALRPASSESSESVDLEAAALESWVR